MLAERVLATLCHPPKRSGGHHPNVDDAMARLRRSLPEIEHIQPGERVLDFGCGLGYHAIGLAEAGADVVGLDINERWLATARRNADARACQRVRFTDSLDGEVFDVVLSYNSMEHFSEPASILTQMRDALAPNGRVMIAFSPPWLSAYGAHMNQITPVPWVHLLFPERAIMRVRGRWHSDGATRFEDVEGGLNRMTLSRFERLVHDTGLRFDMKRYTASRRMPIVTDIPGLREFLTVRAAAILRQR